MIASSIFAAATILELGEALLIVVCVLLDWLHIAGRAQLLFAEQPYNTSKCGYEDWNEEARLRAEMARR